MDRHLGEKERSEVEEERRAKVCLFLSLKIFSMWVTLRE